MAHRAEILIVDDEPGILETLQLIFQHLGHYVEVATDGYEAIDKVKARTFDIVLMDIRMPGINGVEALKEIKSIQPAAAVMMMTGYSVEELVSLALDEGAYGIMYKPIDIDKVIEFIEKVKEDALILIVDDEPAACESLQDILVEKGYRIEIATSGENALEKVEDKDFDVIFIDVKMPVMNGLELYMAMKNVKSNVKAVMMTGYYDEVHELVELAIGNSIYACLHKPIDIEMLLKVINAIIMGRSKANVQSITRARAEDIEACEFPQERICS